LESIAVVQTGDEKQNTENHPFPEELQVVQLRDGFETCEVARLSHILKKEVPNGEKVEAETQKKRYFQEQMSLRFRNLFDRQQKFRFFLLRRTFFH
jgi:hypothetical protein